MVGSLAIVSRLDRANQAPHRTHQPIPYAENMFGNVLEHDK